MLQAICWKSSYHRGHSTGVENGHQSICCQDTLECNRVRCPSPARQVYKRFISFISKSPWEAAQVSLSATEHAVLPLEAWTTQLWPLTFATETHKKDLLADGSQQLRADDDDCTALDDKPNT